MLHQLRHVLQTSWFIVFDPRYHRFKHLRDAQRRQKTWSHTPSDRKTETNVDWKNVQFTMTTYYLKIFLEWSKRNDLNFSASSYLYTNNLVTAKKKWTERTVSRSSNLPRLTQTWRPFRRCLMIWWPHNADISIHLLCEEVWNQPAIFETETAP